MSRVQVDVGALPSGARSVLLEYRLKDDTAFERLGEAFQPVTTWPVEEDDLLVVRGRARFPDGLGPATDVPFDPGEIIADLPALSSLTFPAPAVRQNGPTLEVTPRVPDGEDREDYQFQVVHTKDAADPADGVQVGLITSEEQAVEHAWPEEATQTIHVRPIRVADGEVGAWVTQDVDVAPVTSVDTEDHDDDFTTGTLETTAPGVTPLETVVGGGVQLVNDIALDDLGSAKLDDLAAVSLDMIDDIPSAGTYTTPVYEFPDLQQFMLQLYPELTSQNRVTLTLDDLCAVEMQLRELDPNGDFVDHRLRQLSFTLDGDRMPVVLETQIATSLTASPTFTAFDFEDLVVGHAYYCLAYALRFTLRSFLRARVKLRRIRVRRFCICDPCCCCEGLL